MAEASRDGNRIPTLLAVSNVDNTTPVKLWADPVTHRLLVDLPAGIGDVSGPASAVDGNFASFDGITGKILQDSGYNASSFLTSLSGAVLVDQSTPQTIGATGSRLTKLWAVDITVTNAIDGSVTGNAGTVTNATLTTAFTVNGGTLTLTGNVANSSVLTIGAGAVSVSGSNTGDQTATDFDIKDLTDSTSLRTTWSAKLDNIVEDTTPQLGGQLDVNGQAIGDGTLELLKFSETASAVNEITIKNAATGNAPELQATGDDTNIDLKLVPKGTGGTVTRLKPRVVTAASYTTDTGTSLDVSTADQFQVTAQAGALKFNNPGGTPTEGQKLIIRIKDNGTARALTYDTQFRAMGNALPTTTTISKTMYMGFIFNSTDTKWDLVALSTEA